jgi:hypothetical protein
MAGQWLRACLAATNKSLAKNNKSRTGGEATNQHNRVRSQQRGQSNMKRVKGPDETDVASAVGAAEALVTSCGSQGQSRTCITHREDNACLTRTNGDVS